MQFKARGIFFKLRLSTVIDHELYQPAYGTTLALEICRNWQAGYEPTFPLLVSIRLAQLDVGAAVPLQVLLFSFANSYPPEKIPGLPNKHRDRSGRKGKKLVEAVLDGKVKGQVFIGQKYDAKAITFNAT
ncbi:hypothetical protein C8R46DRAFT_1027548 [Mycena filopes]|nr:hypothetical protein C8R46DRAFT_1027548 [Mycena filopes]